MDAARTAAYFAEVSRDLLTDRDQKLTLDRVVRRAVEVVPPCDLAGITLRGQQHHPTSVATTDPLADCCDAWQYELGEGPCLDAIAHDEAYLITDVAHDARWPRWGPKVARAGIGSIFSVRLSEEGQLLGALNLYARAPQAFDAESIDLALVYASHAATALSSAKLVAGLQTALQSRHLIGVAQGILMSRYDMGLEAAFEVLRRYSSHRNVKLRQVAQQVVDRRGLPDGSEARYLTDPGRTVAP